MLGEYSRALLAGQEVVARGAWCVVGGLVKLVGCAGPRGVGSLIVLVKRRFVQGVTGNNVKLSETDKQWNRGALSLTTHHMPGTTPLVPAHQSLL
jgi:hypothetical protein